MQGLFHDAVVSHEGQEGGLIGEDVSAHFLSHHEARTHTGVGRGVPVGVAYKGLRLLGDAQSLGPQRQLLGVGAGTVATGDEGVLALGNGGKGIQNGSTVLDTGRVSGGAAQNEVVV